MREGRTSILRSSSYESRSVPLFVYVLYNHSRNSDAREWFCPSKFFEDMRRGGSAEKDRLNQYIEVFEILRTK